MELKPCPFCGGVAHMVCFEFNDEYGEPYDTYSAECCVCGISTAFMSRENAEEAWNRRV